MKKTHSKKTLEIVRQWHLFDLNDQILGRVATEIALLLMGKKKVNFSSHLDGGDYVVAVNCEKVKVTGKKSGQKKYYRHSGYPGGFRETTFRKQMEKHPMEIIRHAVSGMLPKNRLKEKRLFRLKLFVGDNHPYQDKLKN
ncbi:MAG TPA: 50S ribosomal protein L13 [Candidatus Bathyarchaeia archaeon]|nr:50S ribosomal protein L13 [Candidatus Bathyarchaeia archaeon]